MPRLTNSRASIRLLLAVALVLASGIATAQRPLLISGYDDVVRQANNTSLLRATRQLMSKDETYTGMPELYRALTHESEGEGRFFIVSATSSWFADSANELLAQAGYPRAELYLRSWLTQWSAEDFKKARFDALMVAHPGRNFVVILDNSSTSLSLAETLLRDSPTRVAAVYLRQTIERSAPAGTITFITAFDIALHELSAGRITQSQVEHVAHAILAETQPNRLLPEYTHCPAGYDPCVAAPRDIAPACASVRAKVLGICAARAAQR